MPGVSGGRDTLPPEFITQVRAQLGCEVEAFLDSLQNVPVSGLRVNTTKTDPDKLRSLLPWRLEPISWTADGFVLPDGTRGGKHPLHAAGLYYLQDPTAMAPVAFLDIEPGQLVLDLAASPGGKSTHAAALLGITGLLVSNDAIRSRIPALQQNIERTGSANVIVTNLAADQIATSAPALFDRVLVDAPCSGEGLFRKQYSARSEWSPAHVAGSAMRQRRLLDSAALTVRPGGLLMYATCTFNAEENEKQIDHFLDQHPGWTLLGLPEFVGATDGSPEMTGSRNPDIARMKRFWPHLTRGEGQTMALLKAPYALDNEAHCSEINRDTRHRCAQTSVTPAWRAFQQAFLPGFERDQEIVQQGNRVIQLPLMHEAVARLPAIQAGLLLGYERKGRFEPAHALAMAIAPHEAGNRTNLELEHAVAYLRGEPFESSGEQGWTLVCFERFTLGWGKRTGQTVKNHYPKGLRWHAS